MATALITVEEEITCSVCFEVYRDPHVLTKCLHTFCLPCIQQLDRGGRVECPQCREITQIADVKKNFTIQNLIEKVKVYQDPVAISSKKCGMCENAEKSVKYLCEECTFFLCNSCEKMHRKIKVDKPHKVTTVSEMIQEFKKKVETSVKELEDELKHIDKQSDNITQNIEQINKSIETQIKQVRKFTHDAKKRLDENETCLTKLIKDVNKTLVRNLTKKQHIYDTSKTELQDKVKLLNEMIQSEDFQTLKDNAESINENIKEQIKKIKASLPEVSEMTQSPVTVKRNDSWDVKDFIQVMVDGDVLESTDRTSGQKVLSRKLYSSLYSKKWVQKNTVDTGHLCFKLCEINNEIWCAADNMITVYNKQCQKINTIKHDRLQDIRSLVALYNNQGIVACGSNGLHGLDTRGQYLTCIIPGEFSDVSVQGDYLYALQWTLCKVIVFKYTQQQWEKVREIQLNYGTSGEDDRLCVTATTICVSSWFGYNIYIYNTEGQSLRTITTNGKKVLLSDVDEDGNCLVADYSNNTMYIVHDNTWQPLILTGKQLNSTFHSLVDTDGHLWVGHGTLCTQKEVTKYAPEN